MSKASLSLGSIPDDLVLDILTHLDTARDVAHFEATSKWTRRLVRQSGWRDFVKTRFPSLRGTPRNVSSEGGWGAFTDRLTYQDRCWNKRGFYLTAYDEIPPVRSGARRSFAGQSVGFQSVMTAAMVSSSSSPEEEEELFVFGAGEDILFRRRPLHSETQDIWAKLTGHETGYAAGTGDVTALSILERHGSSQTTAQTPARGPEIVVGRATGDLQLISADLQTLGDSSQVLLPLDEPTTMGSRTSPGQVAVSWTEWEARNQILASCRSSILTLYNLGPSTEEEEEPELRPITFYDAAKRNLPGETSFMRSVKFMAPDVIACGLGGCYQPLRWARIRPEGLEVFNAAKNSQVSKSSALGDDDKTTVRAIEPVQGMNPNLLLSAWDDGSHRLSDLRTPSDHDAVYRDRFQLYQASSSMLVYGAERFVTGNNWSPSIRFFDFRFPKSYEHYKALPCSPFAPVPSRPFQKEKLVVDVEHHRHHRHRQPADQCKHENGQRCVWHDMSSQQSWQPDAMLHMGSPPLDRVYSLSKASDTSTSFHVGFRGCFIEVSLGLTGHVSEESKKRTAPQGWRAMQPREKISLMETGMGLCGGGGGGRGGEDAMIMEECTGVPKMYFHRPSQSQGQQEMGDASSKAGLSRLDGAYRTGHGRRVWE